MKAHNIVLLVMVILTTLTLISYTIYSGSQKTSEEGDFKGEVAYNILKRLVKLNRYYGAVDRHKAISFIKNNISPYVDKVLTQEFKEEEKTTGKTFLLTNIIARQNLSSGKRIILATHWDTRLWAEKDPDPEKRNRPIPGANDGGSGTAVLLALARITQNIRGIGVDYIFFDGEEFGRPWNNEYCKGSYYFARNIRKIYGDKLPIYAIVIDMVGDKDQKFYYEQNSLLSAPSFYRKIWQIARDLGYKNWISRVNYSIIDDHIPLHKAGIKSVLLIDFDYPYWHTHQDTLDKISKLSLERTGKVLYRVIKRLSMEK